MQPGGEIRRLADHRLLLGGAGSNEIAYHDETGRDPDTDSQRHLWGRELPDSVHKGKASPNRPLSVVLMCCGIAEVHEHPVAHVLGNEPSGFCDLFGAAAMIRADDLPHVLRV